LLVNHVDNVLNWSVFGEDVDRSFVERFGMLLEFYSNGEWSPCLG